MGVLACIGYAPDLSAGRDGGKGEGGGGELGMGRGKDRKEGTGHGGPLATVVTWAMRRRASSAQNLS